MKSKLVTLLSLTALFVVGLSNKSVAALPAADDGSNYSGYTWTNGSNPGSGFQPWSLTTTSHSGAYINQGVSSIGTGTLLQAFDLYGNKNNGYPYNFAEASRSFTSDSGTGVGTLDIGQTFSFTMALPGGIDTVGTAGFDLEAGSTGELNLQYNGSSSGDYLTYTLAGGSATTIPNINDADFAQGISANFTLTGGNSFALTLNTVGGGVVPLDTITGTLNSAALSAFNFYDYQTGSFKDFNFNSVDVSSLTTPAVPEPSVNALLAGGLLALVLVVRRRRTIVLK